jgi:hypothetical protein
MTIKANASIKQIHLNFKHMNLVYKNVYCKFHEKWLRFSKYEMERSSTDNKHDDVINLFFRF